MTEYIGWGGRYTVDVVPLSDAPNPGPPAGMGETSANLISTLFYKFFDSVIKETDPYQQAINAGAFQLAIWKLEYDHGTIADLFSGYLRVTNDSSSSPTAVVSLAQDWIAKTIADTDTTHRASLVALSAGGFQDQVTRVISNPEPGSIAVWLGIAAFGGAMKMRRRRRETSGQAA